MARPLTGTNTYGQITNQFSDNPHRCWQYNLFHQTTKFISILILILILDSNIIEFYFGIYQPGLTTVSTRLITVLKIRIPQLDKRTNEWTDGQAKPEEYSRMEDNFQF